MFKQIDSKGVEWLVAPTGEVRTPAHTSSYTRTRGGKTQQVVAAFPERPLTPYVGRHGYLEVAAMIGGRRVKHLVHRLVGMAYVPGFAEGLTINHIDGNKLNNTFSNLEWVSLAENTKHQWREGLVDLRGEGHPNAVLTSKRVVYIRRLLQQGVSAHALAIVAGVNPETIRKIKHGKSW